MRHNESRMSDRPGLGVGGLSLEQLNSNGISSFLFWSTGGPKSPYIQVHTRCPTDVSLVDDCPGHLPQKGRIPASCHVFPRQSGVTSLGKSFWCPSIVSLCDTQIGAPLKPQAPITCSSTLNGTSKSAEEATDPGGFVNCRLIAGWPQYDTTARALGSKKRSGGRGVRGRAYDHVSIGYPLRGCFF